MRCLLPLIIFLPGTIFAGALENGEPLADNYNLSWLVMKQLHRNKDDRLRPKKSVYNKRVFSYYISGLDFLGRAHTTEGYRNIFYVSYIRSGPYKSEDSTPPPRGHHFILFVNDKGKIEFYQYTDAFRSEVNLQGSVLQIEQNKLDLMTEGSMRYVHNVSSL